MPVCAQTSMPGVRCAPSLSFPLRRRAVDADFLLTRSAAKSFSPAAAPRNDERKTWPTRRGRANRIMASATVLLLSLIHSTAAVRLVTTTTLPNVTPERAPFFCTDSHFTIYTHAHQYNPSTPLPFHHLFSIYL